jgi:hypothetical protein
MAVDIIILLFFTSLLAGCFSGAIGSALPFITDELNVY